MTTEELLPESTYRLLVQVLQQLHSQQCFALPQKKKRLHDIK